MGKQSFLDSVREWVGGVAFRVFLWSIRMTQDEYINTIIYENQRINQRAQKIKETGEE